MQRNNKMPKCQAQQRGDEMQCGRCGLTWGITDADRPECKVVPVKLVERVGNAPYSLRAKLRAKI